MRCVPRQLRIWSILSGNALDRSYQKACHGNRNSPAGRANANPRRGRVCFTPETELQTAHRARGYGTSEFRQNSGRAGARGYQPHQIRRARHDRGDDCAAGQETFRADERDHARAGISATRRRLAWNEIPGVPVRDRRDAQDPRDECLEGRALPAPAALSERRLGPEPAVQESLRRGVRPTWRTTLWLPDR